MNKRILFWVLFSLFLSKNMVASLEEIPQEVFSLVCSFLGPLSSKKCIIEYAPKGLCWDTKKWKRSFLNEVDSRKDLRNMLAVSKTINACTIYYLNFLKERTEELKVIAPRCRHKEENFLCWGLGMVEIKVKENCKAIQDYKKKNCPNAKVTIFKYERCFCTA